MHGRQTDARAVRRAATQAADAGHPGAQRCEPAAMQVTRRAPAHALKHVAVPLHRRLVDAALGRLYAVPLQADAEAVGAQLRGACEVLLRTHAVCETC